MDNGKHSQEAPLPEDRDIQAHVQRLAYAEAARQESEGRYRRITETLTDYIYSVQVIDGRAATTHHGAGCIAVTGYSSDEFAADPFLWWHMVLPEDRAAVEEQAKNILTSANMAAIEHRILRKDGCLRWVRNTPVPYYNAQGVLIAYDGLIQDISARRQAEEELRQSEERYNAFINASSDLMFVKDEGFRHIVVNDATLRFYGKSRAEMLGKTDFDLMPESVAENCRKSDIEALTSQGTIVIEEVVGEQTFEVTKFPLQLKNMQTGIGAIIRDITDNKRAVDGLALERRFIEGIFNSVPGMIYLYDAEGSLVRWNKKHETMTGYSAEELVKMHLLDWYKDDSVSQAAVIAGVQATMQVGFGEAEADLQKKDGTIIPMYFTACPLTISGKQYFTGIGIDITEQRRAKDEGKKLQAQLAQAQKMESVGRLAGGVAHDFNNMLGIILGHADLGLNKLDPTQPIYAHLQQIRKAAERSANLTKQLLAFARKQLISPRVLDLNTFVEGTLKMLRRLLGEDIELAWIPKSNLWPVKIDPSQIDQILANLCVNARDAITGVGKITIETKNVVLDDSFCAGHGGFIPGEYGMLVVSDTGCGMEKETLAMLFEPFFTTKEIGKGTGLGLATVYGIVKQNNGFIHVYSEPGLGTTFSIYLPRHQYLDVQAVEEDHTVQMRRGNETIMVVEDEVEILNLAKTLLENLGYHVLAANTPSEAIALAEQHRGKIHLLITDVIMPKMDGRELSQHLRTTQPNLKRLFMSGYTADVIAHHGVLEEGVNFMQKPFSMQELAAKVREALGQR
jgi:two-component system, cell cycle sensor histidine kinase and response regulator CckA